MANFIRNFIKGKMNKDVDERLVPNGEYIDALNVRMGSTETSEVGVIENSLGNTKLTAITYLGSTLSGDAVTIGAYEDGANETIYWFITDPSFTSSTVTGKLDLIISFNTQTGITTYHVISIWDGIAGSGNTTLNFNSTYLITAVDLVEDILLFSDDYNAPREINVNRSYAEPLNGGAPDGIDPEDILVIKKPPAESPVILETTTGGDENFIEDRFICFAYRYRYLDNEYSATSQWSQPAFFPRAFSFSRNSQLNEGMLNLHNSVSVTYNSGSRRVVGVDLLFKDMGNSIIKVIERVDKEKMGLADETEYTYQFTNSKIFTILSEAEILRLYDNVPRLAQAQTIMGNRLMYGNYVEGYDLLDKDGNPTKLEYITTLISETIGAEGFEFTVQSSNYNFDIFKSVPASSVSFDFTTLEDSLTVGSSISITITFDHADWSGSGAVPDDTTQPEDINFVFVLAQDYDSVYDLSISDEFLDQIGTVSNILPVYDEVNPTSCDGVTFTDQFNCIIPSFLSGTPSYVKYASGIDGPQEPIKVISSFGSSTIELQLPAMRWVDDPTAIVVDIYEYYEVISASATFKAIANPKSLHSNRGYEVGIVYMDEFRRSTTALVSPYNTVHVPCSASELQNSIQIDIPVSQVGPEWANRYKFVIKPDKEGYETIYTSFYFQDPSNNDTWFLIDGENAAKVEIGDRYIVKVDSDGPKNQCASTVVLDKVAQPANFIDDVPLDPDSTENLYQPQGVYMRMDTSNFNAIRDISQTIIQPSRVEVSNLGPVTNLYRLTNAIFPPPPAPPVYEDYLLPALSVINIEVVFRRQPSGSSCTRKDYTYERQFTVGANYASIEDWFYAEGFGSTLNSGIWDTDGGPESDNVWIGNTATTLTELTAGSNTTNYWQLFRNADTLAPNYNALYLTVSGPPACGIFGTFYLTSIIGIKVDVILAGNTIVFETEPTDASPDIWFENEQSFEIDSDGNHLGDPNNPDDQNQDIALNVPAIINSTFFNCWSFGNGVESYKIRDSILGKDMNLGNRVTSTQDKDYKEIRRYADITYSGIYNEESNINKLNEFNFGLSNFKPLEISFGPIQKMVGRETDILVLQEDKISYVLGEKNLLSDLGAGNLLTATPLVLGTQIARIEDFGISSNPESFSQWGPDKFFTDAKRGAAIHLKGSSHANEQLVVISDQGMRSWFRDLFINDFNTQKLGGYDPYMREYVLSTNNELLPSNDPCVECGRSFDLTVTSTNPYTQCFDLGSLVGGALLSWEVLTITGTITVQATYNSLIGTVGPTAVDGSLNIPKDEVIPSTTDLLITATDTATIRLTMACPKVTELTIVLITLTGPTEAGLFIHNEYRWDDDGFISPLHSSLIEFQEGDVNPVISQYETITGPQGAGAIPTDASLVRMYYNKFGFDNYDFNLYRDTFKYFRGNTLYNATDVDIAALVAVSTDATPIVEDNAPDLYYAEFDMATTPPSPNGDYLYMIWDYRFPNPLEPFVFSVEMNPLVSLTFDLPLRATDSNYNFDVDWGDGNSDAGITVWNQAETSHTYSSAGLYTITITGTVIEGWQFAPSSSSRAVRELINWGILDIGTIGTEAFYGCENMVVTAEDVLDLSTTTDLDGFFRDCNSITTIPYLNDWDVSSATTMASMFENCTSFNDDMSLWDTGLVTDFSYMYKNAGLYNQAHNDWDTSSAVNMQGMFYGCYTFNNPLGNWDTSLVNDTSFMFFLNNSFNQDISTWSMSQVTTFEQMFKSCNSYNKPLNAWATLSVTNLDSTFFGCQVFNQPLDNWNTSSVTTMDETFRQCTVYNQPMPSWNLSSCTTTRRMFYLAEAFNQDLQNWDTTLVTDMYGMFHAAYSFDEDMKGWNTGAVTDMSYMFKDAISFNRQITTAGADWDVSSVQTMESMFEGASVFDWPLTTWVPSSVTTFRNMFKNAVAFNQDISAWNTSSATDLSGMFFGAALYNQPMPTSGSLWDVSSVTDFSSMFRNAVAFNQLLSSWNTAAALDMRYMFAGASVYNQAMTRSGSLWDTSLVTNMSYMFQNATAFDGDVTNWITSAVTDMFYMFDGAIVFNQDITGWNTAAVINMGFMFRNAALFNQAIGAIGNWDVTGVLLMTGMFDGAVVFDQDFAGWSAGVCTSFVGFLNGVALSPANYNSLMSKLAAIVVVQGIDPFDAPLCTATTTGAAARLTLITLDGWTFNDLT